MHWATDHLTLPKFSKKHRTLKVLLVEEAADSVGRIPEARKV